VADGPIGFKNKRFAQGLWEDCPSLQDAQNIWAQTKSRRSLQAISAKVEKKQNRSEFLERKPSVRQRRKSDDNALDFSPEGRGPYTQMRL
jgi:hypothetical protein